MTIARGSRVRVAYAQETTYGQQVTVGKLQTLRLVSESLRQGGASIESAEIRSDRQRTGVRRSQIDASGNISSELSYGTYDDFLAAALLSANVRAQGTLTMDTKPIDGDTVTIGSTVYRFKDTMAQANDIAIGAAVANTQASLVATINGTGVAGTDYYAGSTTPHPSVKANAFSGDDSVLTARLAGLAGNAIATTESFTAETNVFDAATLGTTTAGVGWTAAVTVTAATIAAASGDNSFNSSASGFVGFVANEWIYASGFTNANNNGYFKIVTATTAKLVVTGGTLTTEAEGASRTIDQGESITNGTTLVSFNVEREHTELTQELALFLGVTPNQCTITVPTTGAVTVGLDLLGTLEDSITATGGAGYENATTTPPVTSLDVDGLLENQVAITIASFSMTINNNMRQRFVVGSSGVHSVGDGQLNITGNLQFYYEAKALYEKYIDDTETSLALCVTDVSGNGYVIDIPALRFTPGGQGREATGVNDDIMPNLNFSAYMDASESKTIRIVRFAA